MSRRKFVVPSFATLAFAISVGLALLAAPARAMPGGGIACICKATATGGEVTPPPACVTSYTFMLLKTDGNCVTREECLISKQCSFFFRFHANTTPPCPMQVLFNGIQQGAGSLGGFNFSGTFNLGCASNGFLEVKAGGVSFFQLSLGCNQCPALG